VCCASPAAWAPVQPSPNEIKKQASLELRGMFRVWLILWRLARLFFDFVRSPTGSPLKSIRRNLWRCQLPPEHGTRELYQQDAIDSKKKVEIRLTGLKQGD
jgi:hypothetical protein